MTVGLKLLKAIEAEMRHIEFKRVRMVLDKKAVVEIMTGEALLKDRALRSTFVEAVGAALVLKKEGWK